MGSEKLKWAKFTGFETTAAPTFKLENTTIDGLGRLKSATETLTKPDNSTVEHLLAFSYDSLSQLTGANISNIGGTTWTAGFNYRKNGDMNERTINSGTPDSFSYVGNEMTALNSNNLSYDENGNLTAAPKDASTSMTLAYNWDNKLRSAVVGANSISIKYDPAGNRVYKSSSGSVAHKYIVDVAGELPVILMELEPIDGSSYNVKKAYVYANSQILAQYSGANKYYYLHDRLGSVRQMINTSGVLVAMYTYNPFGETIEEQGTISNDFKFTGQWFDSETGQYYLRARQYSPYLARFTTYDPVAGKFETPLTWHRYLYCWNDPVNKIDPTGKWLGYIHNEIIDKAFTGLSKEERKYIKQGSAYADSKDFQTVEFSYMHAMRDGLHNQSVEEAEKLMLGFINQTLEDASFLEWLGLKEESLFLVGMAMHPVMDSTNPLHEGFQVWDGTHSGAVSHGLSEPVGINSDTLQRTEKLINEALVDWGVNY